MRRWCRPCPNLRIEVKQRHVGEDAIVLETIVSGRHRGAWRGLPPTGRPVEFALCGVFTFDAADRLAGERVYYDRATVLRQLGVFHEPDRIPGRISTVLTHPLTVARIVGRRLFGRG
jgi:SnoaL-like polyketide cyclase